MTRLLIDGTPIIVDAKGVGRYAHQLCVQLAERLPRDWTLQLLLNPASRSLFPDDFRAEIIPVQPVSEIANALFVIPRQVRHLKPQLLLKTHEGAGQVFGVPTITVCHDIDRLITMAQTEKRGLLRIVLDAYKQHLRKRALRNSDFLICNSEFTRRAVEEHYGIPPGRTVIGYCAVDSRFYEFSKCVDKSAVRRRYGIEGFILAFATGDPRENFHSFPMVAAQMMSLNVRACLLIAGMKRDRIYVSSLRSELKKLGLAEGKHFIFEDFLGTDRFYDLVELYSAADFYLDLSLHEGFGMQLVEAMACGTTCISSPRGALSEIGDKYVQYVDPLKVKEIAGTIKRAYDNRLHLRDNREQVIYTRKFSWDQVGGVVTKVLLNIAANRLRTT